MSLRPGRESCCVTHCQKRLRRVKSGQGSWKAGGKGGREGRGCGAYTRRTRGIAKRRGKTRVAPRSSRDHCFLLANRANRRGGRRGEAETPARALAAGPTRPRTGPRAQFSRHTCLSHTTAAERASQREGGMRTLLRTRSISLTRTLSSPPRHDRGRRSLDITYPRDAVSG